MALLYNEIQVYIQFINLMVYHSDNCSKLLVYLFNIFQIKRRSCIPTHLQLFNSSNYLIGIHAAVGLLNVECTIRILYSLYASVESLIYFVSVLYANVYYSYNLVSMLIVGVRTSTMINFIPWFQ